MGFILITTGCHLKGVKRGQIRSHKGFDEMALEERWTMDPGSREGSRSASRREMAEPWMQEVAGGIREVAGFGVHRIGIRGSADRNYGWIGSRGGREDPGMTPG